MAKEKIGIWLIGAWGGVATTVAVGLAALRHGLIDETGLVSALPRFAGLNLADWSQFVVGGHEIRRTSYAVEAQALHEQSGVFGPKLLETIRPTLEEFDRNVRTGTLVNVGETIAKFASAETKKTAGERPGAAVERIADDIEEFRKRHQLAHVIVVNAASTEPPPSDEIRTLSWAEMSQTLEAAAESPLPASSLFAIAAMRAKCSFVNFTPSVGSDLPALKEYALEQEVLHVGRDGKTGETLMKSVLAPMFADRNLKVLS